MNTVFTFVLSESVLIPIATALLMARKLKRNWLPFFLMLMLAFIAEVSSFCIIKYLNISNAPVIKIYSLCECCLIVYQFYLWQNKRYGSFCLALTIICVLVWLVENILLQNLYNFVPYFRVFYAFIIVLLSINLINVLMVNQRSALLRNPVFLVCLAFIVFFTYQIIYEASFFVGADKYLVANQIITLFAYVNVLINVVYAVAIWLLAKQ